MNNDQIPCMISHHSQNENAIGTEKVKHESEIIYNRIHACALISGMGRQTETSLENGSRLRNYFFFEERSQRY